ncbi:alkaline phosphatase family protein [Haloarchaeobius amylolyticus]|uniref:alkaline phosphatase family protein n=1 Tax=Haloarchaeobius amylolyticus TaxID=1198296 RepID=UPI00226EE691|nr:alkaline phosphatase family protein [Haloarchaeobius amylolyticus]
MSDDGLDVLLVGIDAGCLPVFDRLAETDTIPTLERLNDEGAVGPLESQIPPWTPSAWPSMYTGVNPGKHGVFGFVSYDGYDWHVSSADHVDELTLWEILDEHGLTSVVVNAPVTHPPAEIDGAILPGFIGPEDPTCHPEGTLDEVRDELGEYRVYPAYSRGDDSYSEAEKMDEYRTLVRMRGEAFSYLTEKHDADFGFVQFQKTDTVFHEFGGDWEKIRSVYEETDDQISRIIDEHDPDTVFVASDHGMGKYEGYEFRVNDYLHDEGVVEVTNGGKGMPSWNPIRNELREGKDVDSWEPGLVEKMASGAAKVGLTASRIRQALEAVNLDDIAMRYAPEDVARTGNKQVDFPESVAYLRSRTELGVRLNVEGREPDGVVPVSEYDDVRAEVIESLRSVTDPDGNPVFDEVVPREQYFEGEHVEDAVDIVTIPRNFQYFLSDQVRDEYFADPTETWNHKLDGIVTAWGEGVDGDADLSDAHLFDVAPTILAALGIPYNERMDGEVLPAVEGAGGRAYRSAETGADRDSPEAAVENRLSDLGYLE